MVSKKKFEAAVNKFHKYLTKSQFKEYAKADISFSLAKILRDLHYENQIIKIGLETIRKVLLKKKILWNLVINSYFILWNCAHSKILLCITIY